MFVTASFVMPIVAITCDILLSNCCPDFTEAIRNAPIEAESAVSDIAVVLMDVSSAFHVIFPIFSPAFATFSSAFLPPEPTCSATSSTFLRDFAPFSEALLRFSPA